MPETRYSALNTGGSRVDNADDTDRRIAQDYMFRAALTGQDAALRARALDLQQRGQDSNERMFNVGEAGQNTRQEAAQRGAVTMGGTFGEKADLTREMAKGQQDTSLLLADKANAPAMGQLALSGRAYDDTRNDRNENLEVIMGRQMADQIKRAGAGGDSGMGAEMMRGWMRKNYGEDPAAAGDRAFQQQLDLSTLQAAQQGSPEAIAQLEKRRPGSAAGFSANPLGKLQKENDTYAAVMESPRIKNEMDAIVEIAKGRTATAPEAVKARIESLAQSLVAMGIPADSVRQAISDRVGAEVPASGWFDNILRAAKVGVNLITPGASGLTGSVSGMAAPFQQDQIRTAAGVR